MTVRMNTDLGEHLLDVEFKSTNTNNFHFEFKNAKSNPVTNRENQFSGIAMRMERPLYQILMQRMVVNPGAVVYYTPIEQVRDAIIGLFPTTYTEELS